MGRTVQPALIVLVCGIIGIVLAFMESMLYDNGYLLNTFLENSGQLVSFQIITILLWLLLGGVIAAASSR